MHVLVTCQIGLLVLAVTGLDEVCYEEVGCFETGEPWSSLSRPVPPPQGPDDVKVFFMLYTRKNPVNPFFITRDTNWTVDGSYYDGQKKTIVFSHGFQGSANESWTPSLRDAILKLMDVNLILVDYSSMENQTYVSSVSNIRVVAAFTSKVLEYLIEEKGASLSRIHLIGFSLGAHISAYVGKRIPGIARITALDAAQPLFEGESTEVRLDRADATLVDAAHTSGSPTVPFAGLGFVSPLGDVDFYFNGGMNQPGCTTETVESMLNGSVDVLDGIVERISCPHTRAVYYFIESVANPNCTFWGITRNAFNSALRFVFGEQLYRCTIDICLPFGMRTFEFPGRGSFSITTNSEPPYCINSTETDKLMGKYSSSTRFP